MEKTSGRFGNRKKFQTRCHETVNLFHPYSKRKRHLKRLLRQKETAGQNKEC